MRLPIQIRICVELNSELILSGMSVSGNVLNVEYSIWRTKVLSDARAKWSVNRTRRVTMHLFRLQYVQVALGPEWPSFFFLAGPNFTHAQINIMCELDSTRQKFDVWISIAFLSINATTPVKRAAEMRQPIQKSNFCQIWFDEFSSTRPWLRNATYEPGLT